MEKIKLKMLFIYFINDTNKKLINKGLVFFIKLLTYQSLLAKANKSSFFVLFKGK